MLLAPLLVLSGCGGPTAATIAVAEVLVSHKPGRVDLGARALAADGEPVADVAITAVHSADERVARVGRDGSVACESLGSARITLQTGDVTTEFELRCLLISAIKPAHEDLTLEAASDAGYALQWQVLDLAGQPVEGVPVALSVADPSVARVDGVQIYGVTPGRTTMTWTAGELSAQVAVRVGKVQLKHEALPVAKGGTDLDLRAGEWTITVSAQDEVTVSVFEGRCSETDAGLLHHLVCRPTADTRLHVEPTGLLRDPTTAHVRGVYYPGS